MVSFYTKIWKLIGLLLILKYKTHINKNFIVSIKYIIDINFSNIIHWIIEIENLNKKSQRVKIGTFYSHCRLADWETLFAY